MDVRALELFWTYPVLGMRKVLDSADFNSIWTSNFLWRTQVLNHTLMNIVDNDRQLCFKSLRHSEFGIAGAVQCLSLFIYVFSIINYNMCVYIYIYVCEGLSTQNHRFQY